MRHIKRLIWVLPIFVVALILGVIEITKPGESKVEVSGGDSNEIVVTISSADRSLLDEGDALRKAFKFIEAIEVYQNVLADERTDAAIKAEANYNIGLCHTWLGELSEAEAVFNDILHTYSDDGKAMAYAEYCMAWVEIQKMDFHKAIERLTRMLENKTCDDMELYSRTQFQIGRIYQAYLNDWERAKEPLRKVIVNYPDAKIISHPFLNPYRSEK
ncbi:MAG TPA: tetratricopeptide repeat protein [bacterium]|nr:tetratricopeptide repeat protein [bacterium]